MIKNNKNYYNKLLHKLKKLYIKENKVVDKNLKLQNHKKLLLLL